jgi:hypothetical protein
MLELYHQLMINHRPTYPSFTLSGGLPSLHLIEPWTLVVWRWNSACSCIRWSMVRAVFMTMIHIRFIAWSLTRVFNDTTIFSTAGIFLLDFHKVSVLDLKIFNRWVTLTTTRVDCYSAGVITFTSWSCVPKSSLSCRTASVSSQFDLHHHISL